MIFLGHAGDAVAQVVIVPGNPGSALLYLPFLKLLFEAHRGKVDVMVISHLGHDMKSSHGDQVGVADHSHDL